MPDAPTPMPAALSLDLRQRIVQACLTRGLPRHTIAEHFAVSVRSVERLMRRHRLTPGDLTPRHAPGATRMLCADDDALIASFVRQDIDATLPELAERFASETGRHLSPATVSRSLVRSSMTRKKRHFEPPSSFATT